ncbi:MAG: hypothetical protein PHR16_03760 [Methylovulum sp.]|nr:hypothetical protein [Methylovulum sp.]
MNMYLNSISYTSFKILACTGLLHNFFDKYQVVIKNKIIGTTVESNKAQIAFLGHLPQSLCQITYFFQKKVCSIGFMLPIPPNTGVLHLPDEVNGALKRLC